MSKVKKVLRTIIAEEVAKEVRQLIKENQKVSQVDKVIDQKLTPQEVQAFAPYVMTVPKLVELLTGMIKQVSDEHNIKDEDMNRALKLIYMASNQAMQQGGGKLEDKEAAEEAMRRR